MCIPQTALSLDRFLLPFYRLDPETASSSGSPKIGPIYALIETPLKDMINPVFTGAPVNRMVNNVFTGTPVTEMINKLYIHIIIILMNDQHNLPQHHCT